MLQVSESVGTAQKGSMNAVLGSGIASMSEASMLFQPRMLEPSKPSPSSKTSSVSSLMGQLKCCHVPKVSTNLMSTILAPLFLASSSTLLGVLIEFSFLFVRYFKHLPRNFVSGRNNKSDSLFARFFRANANRIFNRTHKNFPVANLAGLRRLDDRLDSRFHIGVREHNFQFQLW